MSEAAKPLRLEVAYAIAERIVDHISPFCERIQIAGSMRRKKRFVGDIDLVAIPKMTSKWAMFCSNDVTETDFAEAVRDLIVPEAFGQKVLRGPTRCSLTSPDAANVDIYIATPETWATILLIRTGSVDHNIWMAARAKACGGALHANGSGLDVPGQVDPVTKMQLNHRRIRAEKEEEIFSAMGIATPKPEDREIQNGKPAWMVAR